MNQLSRDYDIAQLGEIYTDMYQHDDDPDSPLESRVQMAEWATRQVAKRNRPVALLDVGSGARAVGKEMILGLDTCDPTDETVRDMLTESLVVSFDIADIAPEKLTIGRASLDAAFGTNHLRAQSQAMPFKDQSFDVVMSNLSIDMLRRQEGEFEKALAELARVTKVDGAVRLHYHPGTLFLDLSDEYRSDQPTPMKDYFHGVADENPFYTKQEAIVEDMSRAGLTVLDVAYEQTTSDSWWRVEAMRCGKETPKEAVQQAIVAHLKCLPESRASGRSLDEIRQRMGMQEVSKTRFRKAVGGLAAGEGVIGWRRPSWGSEESLQLGGYGITQQRPLGR